MTSLNHIVAAVGILAAPQKNHLNSAATFCNVKERTKISGSPSAACQKVSGVCKRAFQYRKESQRANITTINAKPEMAYRHQSIHCNPTTLKIGLKVYTHGRLFSFYPAGAVSVRLPEDLFSHPKHI
jgi:hypothetical protein